MHHNTLKIIWKFDIVWLVVMAALTTVKTIDGFSKGSLFKRPPLEMLRYKEFHWEMDNYKDMLFIADATISSHQVLVKHKT